MAPHRRKRNLAHLSATKIIHLRPTNHSARFAYNLTDVNQQNWNYFCDVIPLDVDSFNS